MPEDRLEYHTDEDSWKDERVKRKMLAGSMMNSDLNKFRKGNRMCILHPFRCQPFHTKGNRHSTSNSPAIWASSNFPWELVVCSCARYLSRFIFFPSNHKDLKDATALRYVAFLYRQWEAFLLRGLEHRWILEKLTSVYIIFKCICLSRFF
jgi:hypothetical protein